MSMKDLYVLEYPGVMSHEASDRIAHNLKTALGEDARVIILEEGAKLRPVVPPINRDELIVAADLVEEAGFQDVAKFLRDAADNHPALLPSYDDDAKIDFTATI